MRAWAAIVMESDFYCSEILSGRTPITKVMETNHVMAYHHTRPSWKIHIVVIPKTHFESLLSLTQVDAEILLEMMGVIRAIVEAVTREHGRCRLTTNFGACQQTKHLHWHIYVDGG